MDGLEDYGARGSGSRGRSRSRSRTRRSRAASSSSDDSDAYFPSLGKTAYKRVKKSQEKEMRKKLKGSSALDTPKGQLAMMQGINLADRVRSIKGKMIGSRGSSYKADDEIFKPLSDVSDWDSVKKAAEEAFAKSDDAIKVVTDFQYLLATMDQSRETDQALSRVFDVSRAEYATPLGKKVLEQLLLTVKNLKPRLTRTIRALEALYRPHRAALLKAAKGGKNAGLYLARAQALGEDKTFDKPVAHRTTSAVF
jgi:hypothetical protein